MLRPCRRLPNQCLTKSPPYLTFLTVIEVRISLILGNLLISGIYSQNPAYRPVPPFLNVPGNFRLGLLQRKARSCSWLALSISACTESSVSILASGPHMFVQATIWVFPKTMENVARTIGFRRNVESMVAYFRETCGGENGCGKKELRPL
jgi:hypothetical protein